jgi:predicted DNA-binding transcriptional regulator AlpA
LASHFTRLEAEYTARKVENKHEDTTSEVARIEKSASLLCMKSVASLKRSSVALVYRKIHRVCVFQLPGNQRLSHRFQGWVLGNVLQLVRELRLEDGRGGVLGDEALLEAVRRLLGSCSAAPGRRVTRVP